MKLTWFIGPGPAKRGQVGIFDLRPRAEKEETTMGKPTIPIQSTKLEHDWESVSFRVAPFPGVGASDLNFAVLVVHQVGRTTETVEIVTALCSTEHEARAVAKTWDTPARVVQLMRDERGRPVRWVKTATERIDKYLDDVASIVGEAVRELTKDDDDG